MSKLLQIFRTNVQMNQIAILMTVLFFGIFYYGIYFSVEKFCVVFGTTAFFEIVFSRLRYGKWSFPYSGIPAGFGISFFLRTDVLLLYVLAGFLAISSKYLFRIQDRHFFNPSNFGSFIVLVLFPYVAWTNPLQWGRIQSGEAMLLLYIALITLGFLIMWRVYINLKVNLLYISVPFVVTHFLIVFFLSQEQSISYHLIYAPSFFIFLFYMITDPKTILDNLISRAIFGSLVAVCFFLLQYVINENYSLLGSLFFLTMIIPIIRYYDSFKIYKNITIGNVIIFTIFLCCILTLFTIIYNQGFIDLVFDNRCRNLFCN